MLRRPGAMAVLAVILSKLSSFRVFPASYQLGVGRFAEHPDIGPSWKAGGAVIILLPRLQ